MFGKRFRTLAALLSLVVVLLLVLRPWTWWLRLPLVREPLPPAGQLREPPARPGTFPYELQKLLDQHERLLTEPFADVDKVDEATRQRWQAQQHTVAARLRAALAAPDGNWPDEDEQWSPWVERTRQLGRYISAWAVLELEAGRAAEALDSILLVAELGRRLSRRSNIMRTLVAIAVESQAYASLLRWMSSDLADEQLLRQALQRLRDLEAQPASWQETLAWEYVSSRVLLLAPQGLGPAQRMLLTYLGVIGRPPLSVLAAVFHDARRWEELPPETLWQTRWQLSGPASPPSVPGLKLTRAELDAKLRRNAIVFSIVSPLRSVLAARTLRELRFRLTLVRLALHCEQKRTGKWPGRITTELLSRYNLPQRVGIDPFRRQEFFYYVDRSTLLETLKRPGNELTESLGRQTVTARLRSLLQKYPAGEPLCWCPLVSTGHSSPTAQSDHLRHAIQPITWSGHQYLQQAAQK